MSNKKSSHEYISRSIHLSDGWYEFTHWYTSNCFVKIVKLYPLHIRLHNFFQSFFKIDVQVIHYIKWAKKDGLNKIQSLT